MRKTFLVCMAVFATSATGASALPIGINDGIKAALNEMDLTIKAQVFIVGGRRFCFYFDGWNGPGWYQCGFAFRRGFGWGGRLWLAWL